MRDALGQKEWNPSRQQSHRAESSIVMPNHVMGAVGDGSGSPLAPYLHRGALSKTRNGYRKPGGYRQERRTLLPRNQVAFVRYYERDHRLLSQASLVPVGPSGSRVPWALTLNLNGECGFHIFLS